MIQALGSIENSPISGIELGLDFQSKREKERQGSSSFAVPARENTDATGLKIDPEKQEQIRALQQRDQEVRSHEQAHQAAGGGYAGGASYTYQKGPNGQMYAIGGSVSIDSGPVPGDPEATIAKARQVRAAALAPGNPSGQDMKVAASAQQMESQAQQEKTEKDRAERQGEGQDSQNPNAAQGISAQSDQTGNAQGQDSGQANSLAAQGIQSPQALQKPESADASQADPSQDKPAQASALQDMAQNSASRMDMGKGAITTSLYAAPLSAGMLSDSLAQSNRITSAVQAGASNSLEWLLPAGETGTGVQSSQALSPLSASLSAETRLSDPRHANSFVTMLKPESRRAAESGLRAYQQANSSPSPALPFTSVSLQT